MDSISKLRLKADKYFSFFQILDFKSWQEQKEMANYCLEFDHCENGDDSSSDHPELTAPLEEGMETVSERMKEHLLLTVGCRCSTGKKQHKVGKGSQLTTLQLDQQHWQRLDRHKCPEGRRPELCDDPSQTPPSPET